MEYVIPALIVILLIAGFVTFLVVNATEKGGEGYDLKNVAPAVLHGALNVAVLGSLQKVANGVSPLVNRVAAKGVIGVAEQMGADVVAGATGLQAGYGVLGDIAQGKSGEALQHATVQALTFAAFAALHGKPADSKAVLDGTAEKLDALAKQGVSPDAAAGRIASLLPEPEAAGKDWSKVVERLRPEAPTEKPQPAESAGWPPEKPLESGVSADPLAHWSDKDVWDAAVSLTGLKSKGKVDRKKALDALANSGIPPELLSQFTRSENVPSAEQRYAKPAAETNRPELIPRPEPEQPARPEPAPAKPRERLSSDLLKDVRAAAASERRATGSRLGADFLKGISKEKSEGKGAAPRAAISGIQMAGLAAA